MLVFYAVEEGDVSRSGSRVGHASARIGSGGAPIDGTGASGGIRIGVLERDGSGYRSAVGFDAQYASLRIVAQIRYRHVVSVAVAHEGRAVLPASEPSSTVRARRVTVPSADEFSSQVRTSASSVRFGPSGRAD